MSDFQTVAAEIVAGVLNTHPTTTALVKAAMVRQLQNLSSEVINFMEVSGSFSTVANQAAYSGADAGYPDSLLRFDRLWYDLGNYARPLEVIDIFTIRALQEHGSAVHPTRICWYEEKLQFGPAPAGVYTVKYNAVLDARRNTADGALITTASTTQTNAWFTTGVVPFRHLVWADFFMTSPDTRPDMAENHTRMAGVALSRLREAGRKKQEMNGVVTVPSAFDHYSGSGSGRISLLFPGAPV
jgi:hypothetical protein